MSSNNKPRAYHRKSESCENATLNTEPTAKRPLTKPYKASLASNQNSRYSQERFLLQEPSSGRDSLAKYLHWHMRKEKASSKGKKQVLRPHHKRGFSDAYQMELKYSLPPPVSETDPRLPHKERIQDSIVLHFKTRGLPPPTRAEFYQFGKLLGKGAFGKVFQGTHVLTGLPVAIKRIEKSFIKDERSRAKFFQEVFIMKRVSHSNVIRLLEVFESSKHLVIVLEYAGGGDLLQLVKARGKLPESEAKLIFRQIVEGVRACHARNIVHRDIKLDNILLNAEFTQTKLCDFGVSRVATPGQKVTEQCGTPAYLAPEIIVNNGYEPLFVDLWSLGVLLYAMLCGSAPFKAATLSELHKVILQCRYKCPAFLTDQAKDFIAQLLNPVPHLRMSLDEMAAHEWFSTSDCDSSFEDSAAPRFVGCELPVQGPSCQAKILVQLRTMGFPEDYVVQSLKVKDVNHATATYNLLDLFKN